jgi:hypothetical protein
MLVFNFYNMVILSCDLCIFSIKYWLSRNNARTRYLAWNVIYNCDMIHRITGNARGSSVRVQRYGNRPVGCSSDGRRQRFDKPSRPRATWPDVSLPVRGHRQHDTAVAPPPTARFNHQHRRPRHRRSGINRGPIADASPPRPTILSPALPPPEVRRRLHLHPSILRGAPALRPSHSPR